LTSPGLVELIDVMTKASFWSVMVQPMEYLGNARFSGP